METMNELALFAGAGGGILGGKLLGWRTVCAVEIDSYARRVLLARQADGCLDPFPIWDDVTTFNGHQWRSVVDVVSGGFPCQDISAAGKRAGLDGEQSGLWAEMARIIGEVQPAFVWVENSPMLLVRGIDRVLWDLAALGYDARWGVVSAAAAGAPHKRERCWIMAYANQNHRAEAISGGHRGLAAEVSPGGVHVQSRSDAGGQAWWRSEPGICRVADGMADQLDELACLGNGQVPAVVRLAWNSLSELCSK
jgi:DNA (cytosine-5)-methyltransferase 1